ncbi:hypothetical protein CHS0354_009298 [Potamilus streckersoni]|uniref:3'-5' exonuclease domain-containing protein n=1 Tax=Potamilus streckersoni TaxID=2493646 RepID=A0AAE0T6J3_9BIVA|nr:hypothetical protein CHS0354_009298 [Potamilus streckersoni]
MTTWDGEVYIFDVKINPDLMYDGGLMRLLQSVDLIKVLHDCSVDSANLSGQFGVKLQNIYDTQLAYSVIIEGRGLPPRRLSLPALCDKYKIARYTPSRELQRLLNDDPNVWARRPLTRDMLNTAAADALPLVPALYIDLNSSLPEDKWEWFCHLCEQNSLSLLPCKKYAKRRPKTGLAPHELPVYTLADWQEKNMRESCPEQHKL